MDINTDQLYVYECYSWVNLIYINIYIADTLTLHTLLYIHYHSTTRLYIVYIYLLFYIFTVLTSCACAGVATLPVPIAHTGSYAMTIFDQSVTPLVSSF